MNLNRREEAIKIDVENYPLHPMCKFLPLYLKKKTQAENSIALSEAGFDGKNLLLNRFLTLLWHNELLSSDRLRMITLWNLAAI